MRKICWLYKLRLSKSVDSYFIHFESPDGKEYGEYHEDGSILFRDIAPKPAKTPSGMREFRSAEEFNRWRFGRPIVTSHLS